MSVFEREKDIIDGIIKSFFPPCSPLTKISLYTHCSFMYLFLLLLNGEVVVSFVAQLSVESLCFDGGQERDDQ